MRRRRSISPTDRSEEASRPRMARRFGSARIANEDSMPCIYFSSHMPVKSHESKNSRARKRGKITRISRRLLPTTHSHVLTDIYRNSYISSVVETFAALSEPNRYRIVELLRGGASSVGAIGERLDLSQ